MNERTTTILLDVNRQFYQTFAAPFSATRQRIQPGVRRILEHTPPDAAILDLGCGNGELARGLARAGHRGAYLGLDFSAGLLAAAQTQALPGHFTFRQAELADVRVELPTAGFKFQFVLAFAVLHHIPGRERRLNLLRQAREALAPGGRLIHSEWQFLNSPRLRARIQPWERIGLSAAEVAPDDYLLDWRSGGNGLRYVHHFSEDELAALAAQSGFSVAETFYSDGESGNLGLYQVWDVQPPVN